MRSLSTPLTLIFVGTLFGSFGCGIGFGDGDGNDDVGDGDGDGDGDSTGSDSTGTDSTGTDTGDGDGDTSPPPESCTPQEEGFYWCTHAEADGPEGSALYVCTAGVWVEDVEAMYTACAADNYDFAYGCIDNGTEVVFECGLGTGEACTDTDPVTCVDGDIISYCQWGKETEDSCLTFCQEVGVDGVTYLYGVCDDSMPADVACSCCDTEPC